MMSHDHIRTALYRLINKLRSAIKSQKNRCHRSIGRTDAKSAVIPFLLNGERGELLNYPCYVFYVILRTILYIKVTSIKATL